MINVSSVTLFNLDNAVEGSYPKGLNYAESQNPLNTEEKFRKHKRRSAARRRSTVSRRRYKTRK